MVNIIEKQKDGNDMEFTKNDLKINKVYRAKKPKKVGFFGRNYDDRMLIYMGLYDVQYDSPTIKFGGKYKRVTIEKFLKWVDSDVTDTTPDGDWEIIK